MDVIRPKYPSERFSRSQHRRAGAERRGQVQWTIVGLAARKVKNAPLWKVGWSPPVQGCAGF